ncbi:DNA primase [Listeria sp. PSOL-1]|uniref:DNA primase n=1 Tax=Listeria sp. PSOL-1 TaxID=1844999 RepID=UPI0013D62A42|nr:DNA primase [Listeria sp. PSOL-1]
MRRIPEETIERVRAETDIIDVIGSYVQLKKQGRNYIGLCPFHGEKTPSFSVSPEKQIFHCFGCGKGGNVFSFLMEHDHLSFVEAVKKVAEFSHIEVLLPEQSSGLELNSGFEQEASDTIKMIELHQLVAKLYHYLLMETDEGLKAFNYLKERGMSEKMMTAFQIGFSPQHHMTITSFLEKRGADLDLAEKSGLLSRREDGTLIDRFRGRIMFPITNDRGQLVGFSGRAFEQDQGPKYLNSPETPLFNKRKLLYHFSEGRQAIRKKEEILLLEGFMDVISVFGVDLKNGVASMGTSLTEEHVALIRRITNCVVICYDGDQAGIEAAYRAGQMIREKSSMEIFVLQLPNGKDPDEYIKANSGEKFKEVYDHMRLTWTAFKLLYLRRNHNLQNETEQLSYIDQALKEIAELSQATHREIYLKQLASEFDLTIDALKEQLMGFFKKKPQFDPFAGMIPPEDQRITATASFAVPKKKLEAHVVSEQQLMKIMIESREAFWQIQEMLGSEEFYHDEYQALYTHLIGFYAEDNKADVFRLIDYLRDAELKNLVSSLEMIDSPVEQGLAEYQDYIHGLKKFKLEIKLKQLKKELQACDPHDDKEDVTRITTQIIELQRKLMNKQFD